MTSHHSACVPSASPAIAVELDLGTDPLSLNLEWADGTPFRVVVYSPSQWDRLPADGRPQAFLDDTGRAFVALTDAPEVPSAEPLA